MKRPKLKLLQQDESGRTALGAAALLADPVELPLLTALGVATDKLELLFDSGVLEPLSPVAARWTEVMKKAEALEFLAWSERRRLHERLALLLEPLAGRLFEAAQHYLAACRYAEARSLLLREALSACAGKRYESAVVALDQCLSIWPADEERDHRLHILEEMARCARNSGRQDLARRACLEILDMVKPTDARLAARAHQQLADLAMLEQDFEEVRRRLEAAAIEAEKEGRGVEAGRHWFALASFLADQTRTRSALMSLERAREAAGEPCDPALDSELLGFEGLLQSMLGQPARANELVQKSLEVAVRHHLKREAAIAYRRMANIREYDSDYAGERDAHLHAVALCRKQNETESEQTCLTCLSYVFFRTGEWKRALATTRNVLSDAEAHPALKAGAAGVESMIAAFRGNHRQALSGLEESRVALRKYGVLSLEFHLLWAQAFALESEGDHDAASRTYLHLLDLWDDTDDRHDVVPGAVSAAAFFRDTGDQRQMARITDVLHTVVAANDNKESRAARAAVLAENAASAKDWKGAIGRMIEARDGYDLLGVPIERALIRRRLGRVLADAGQDRDASAELESCAGIARSLGMRSVLASVDVVPGRPPVSKQALLTARQHDVLRMLAAGLTNKETAARLHLSPRTVEMHVASLLDRLNCHTRAAAIRKAGQLHLLD